MARKAKIASMRAGRAEGKASVSDTVELLRELFLMPDAPRGSRAYRVPLDCATRRSARIPGVCAGAGLVEGPRAREVAQHPVALFTRPIVRVRECRLFKPVEPL